MVAERGVHVAEQHAHLVELVADLVVHDLALVLRGHAAQVLLLRLRDPELVPGPLDVLREVLPGLGLLLGRADEVVDVVEVDVGEVGAPPRHGPAPEVLEGLQPVLAHPIRLALECGDLLHDGFGQPLLRHEHRMVGVMPPEAVALVEFLEVFFLGDGHALSSLPYRPPVTGPDENPGGLPTQSTAGLKVKSIREVGIPPGLREGAPREAAPLVRSCRGRQPAPGDVSYPFSTGTPTSEPYSVQEPS